MFHQPIPDHLHRAVKTAAAARRITMREFLLVALAAELERSYPTPQDEHARDPRDSRA